MATMQETMDGVASVRRVGPRLARIEGAAAFVAGLALFGWLGGPWLLVIPLLLSRTSRRSATCVGRASVP